MAHHGKARLLGVMILFLAAATLPAQEGRGGSDLQGGINLFRSGQYERAIVLLRGVLADPSAGGRKADAYLWIGKSYLALGKLDDASQNIAIYLSNYPDALDRAEALYQKGRILFLQTDYEGAIRELQGFVATYPQSPLVSSAYYWVGECLFSLGKLDEAAAVFRKIAQDYPTSVKVEAAQYRLSLIEITRREVELTKLLKWSHEDLLRNIADFQRREKTYEQVIEAYQKKLGVSEAAKYQAAIDEQKKQIDELAKQIDDQKKQIDDLKSALDSKASEAASLAAALDDARAQASAAAARAAAEAAEQASREKQASDEIARQRDALAKTQRLLSLKEEALTLKSAYLDWLESRGGAR